METSPGDPIDSARRGDVTIAVNPGASRASAVLDARAVRAAAAAGYRPHLEHSSGPQALEALARGAVERGDPLFAVIGGDGSVARAAGVLAGTPVPLLVIPAGTGNLLAAALGVPRKPARSLELLTKGTCRVIDLGVAETSHRRRIFTVAAGAGFDARVMAATPDARKRRLGAAAYLISAARRVPAIRNARFRLTADGVPVEADAVAVLVANCLDRALGVLRPRVPIDPDDGRLDVFVVPGRNGIQGLVSVARLFRAPISERAPDRGAFRIRATELTIEAEPAQPLELDGDAVAGETPVTLRSLPSALRIVTS